MTMIIVNGNANDGGDEGDYEYGGDNSADNNDK